jgi:DNA-binding GntR family transcriptional regulator
MSRNHLATLPAISRLDVMEEASNQTQRCVDLIVNLIRTQELSPGERLGEVAMAQRLKLGRAPVRAAFDQLAQAGLLERITRSGTFVRKVSLQEYCELVDLRAGLESVAARVACLRIRSEELDKLHQLASRLDDQSQRAIAQRPTDKYNPQVFRNVVELESDFHATIVAASGNKRIIELLKAQQILERCFLLGQSIPPLMTPAGAKSPPNHKDVVAALRTRDPEVAGDVMLKHLLLAKEHFAAAALGLSTEQIQALTQRHASKS